MTPPDILEQIKRMSLDDLLSQAAGLRDQGWGRQVSYSRKVFIPLTQLCRDVCHYCTYAKTPKRLEQAYMSPEQVLAVARTGQAQGCKEALFTLGDKPELRYAAARAALEELGYDSTVSYLRAMAQLVLNETGLLPHLNPGVLSLDDYKALRSVAPSMGIMLESSSARLCERGQPHFGSPDKHPEVRIAAIANAGIAQVALTTGLLIGIGETRAERLHSLQVIQAQHQRYGHIQEIIIQNFVPKADTRMHSVPAPVFDELLWTIASARLIFGPDMSIQAPPNLNHGRLAQLLSAGINDWGGVSPVTPDHVNPESPWPHLDILATETAQAGFQLVERLTIYPAYIEQRDHWLAGPLVKSVLQHADSAGLARTDDWTAGDHRRSNAQVVSGAASSHPYSRDIAALADKAASGKTLSENEIVDLFGAREEDFEYVCQAADNLRQNAVGSRVSYVVNPVVSGR